MHRRRFSVSTVIVSLAWIAVFLTIAPVTLRSPMSSATAEDRSIEVVIRYYDFLNAALENGGLSSLDSIVHPDLFDHSDARSDRNPRQVLEEQIAQLLRFAPDSRVVPTSISAKRDVVQATTSIESASADRVLGLVIDTPGALWPSNEIFRVQEELIVERAFEDLTIVAVEQIDPAEIRFEARQFRFVQIETYSLSHDLAAPIQVTDSPGLMIAQTSDVRLIPIVPGVELLKFAEHRTGSDRSERVTPSAKDPLDLEKGDMVILPPWARVKLIGMGSEKSEVAVMTTPTILNPEIEMRRLQEIELNASMPNSNHASTNSRETWQFSSGNPGLTLVEFGSMTLAAGAILRVDPATRLLLILPPSEATDILTQHSSAEPIIDYYASSEDLVGTVQFRTDFATGDAPALVVNSGNVAQTVWLVAVLPEDGEPLPSE